MTMQELLDRFHLAEDEVAQAVSEAVADLPATGAAALTSDQVGALSRGGLEFGGQTVAAGHRAHRDALAEQVALLAGSDTAAVARTTGVSESRIRHQAAAGSLLAVRVGRGLRFPSFQFDAQGQPLPGLRAVLAAVSPTWPPAQVGAFITTPQPELTVRDERPATPAEWLVAGGDPTAVTALLGPDWT
jgi:hypothetical protein